MDPLVKPEDDKERDTHSNKRNLPLSIEGIVITCICSNAGWAVEFSIGKINEAGGNPQIKGEALVKRDSPRIQSPRWTRNARI